MAKFCELPSGNTCSGTKLKVYYPLDFETLKKYYLSNGSFWRYVFYMKNT